MSSPSHENLAIAAMSAHVERRGHEAPCPARTLAHYLLVTYGAEALQEANRRLRSRAAADPNMRQLWRTVIEVLAAAHLENAPECAALTRAARD